MAYSTLDNAFILDIEGGGKYTFQFLPESITDSKSSNWNEYVILGRSSPLRGYSYGPSRTVGFTVVMFADPTMDGPGLSPGEIKQKTDWLLSLPYPDYNGGIKPPHRCFINIGSNIQMTGVCLSASAEYKRGKPWELGPGLTHGVEVSLQFAECVDIPLGVAERRGGASGSGSGGPNASGLGVD